MKQLRFWATLIASTSMFTMPMLAKAASEPCPAGRAIATKPNNARPLTPREQAAKNAVATSRANVQRVKPSLRTQKLSLIQTTARAEALRPVRLQLRQQAIDATAAFRASPNSATKAAADSASAAYRPVRQAHEAARGQRDAARFRYLRTKNQMKTALASASHSAPPANVRAPTPGRPVMRREARVANLVALRGFASGSLSPQNAVSGASAPPRPAGSNRPEGHYATSAAEFRRGMDFTSSNYSTFSALEAGNAAASPRPNPGPTKPTVMSREEAKSIVLRMIEFGERSQRERGN
jgi:hypothetical protein